MTFPLRDRIAVGAAVVAPLVVSLVLIPFRTDLTSANLALILVVAVVGISVLGNRLAGALAALSSAVWFDFFLTRPFERFTIDHGNDIATAALLLVVGLAVSQLAVRARRLRVVTAADAGHVARLHDSAELSRTAGSADTVVERVRRQLVDTLELRSCRFEYGSLLGHPARLEQDGRIVVDRETWDLERRGWPQGEIELRATANGHYTGRFLCRPTPGRIPSRKARLVAVTLADHAAAALDTAGPATGG